MASWAKEVVLTANQEESWAVQLLASSIEIYKFMCYNISIASKFCME